MLVVVVVVLLRGRRLVAGGHRCRRRGVRPGLRRGGERGCGTLTLRGVRVPPGGRGREARGEVSGEGRRRRGQTHVVGGDHGDDRDGHGLGGQWGRQEAVRRAARGLLCFGHMVGVAVVVVAVVVVVVAVMLVDGGGVVEVGAPVLGQLLQAKLLLQLILLCGNKAAP